MSIAGTPSVKPTAKRPAFNIKALTHQMERLAQLEAGIKNCPPDEVFLGSARLAGLGIFRLVVMGEIKKGKSSFINALIGTDNLVPVHSDVATSTIFKIHYGPVVKYTVYFQKESGKPKLEIESGAVNDYGTEDGNPDNVREVDFIRVESPSPILKNGLVIVDTPGVGGLFKKHREITFRHAPNADAVFFITDSIESPIGADEVKFLKELRQITSLITFVQTKSSKADGDARKARMDNNLSILKEQVCIPAEEISYFIVDSNLKIEADENLDADDLNDSGFGPLMAFLNNTLRKNQEANIAKTALARASSKLIPLATHLDERKRILDANTTEEREKLTQEISNLQQRLVEWEKTSKPHILDDFRKGIAKLTREVQDELRPLQPGGLIQVNFESEIEKATDAEQVRVLLTQVHNDLAALTSTACLRVSQHAQTGVTSLLTSLSNDVSETMAVETLATEIHLRSSDHDNLWVNTSSIARMVERQTGGGFYENARTTVYGGMAGVTIAGIAGGLVGSVIPVVGTIVGSWVGMTLAGIWGAGAAQSIVANQKLEAMKRESYSALQQSMASAYQSATSQISALMSDMQSEATSLLQKMVADTNENLSRQREELNRRQRATQQELAQEQKSVAAFSTELVTISKALETFRAAIPA